VTGDFSLEDARVLITKVAGLKVENVEITAATRFDDLDLASLELAEMFFEVESRLGMRLDPGEASDPETVGEMVDWINAMARRASAASTR
jgi:acyl carrier protein